jgi:hypothetical protein
LNIEPGQTELVKRLGVHVQSLHVDTDITEWDTVKQIFNHLTAFGGRGAFVNMVSRTHRSLLAVSVDMADVQVG